MMLADSNRQVLCKVFNALGQNRIFQELLGKHVPRIENPRVGGSIPPLGTITPPHR